MPETFYNWLQNHLLLLESNLSNKNLFYGLKSMLNDGDNFVLLTDRNIDTDNKQTMSCQFTYKGTRHIKVFTGAFSKNKDFNNISHITVTIFEVTPEGKTIDKLDTNAFYNKGGHLDISHDPIISTVDNFVKYVKSVLDRTDRNDDDKILPPKSPSPHIDKEIVTH
jgi:hypothetical protein